MVHCERQHDEVEVAHGQCILETAHAQIGSGDRGRVGWPELIVPGLADRPAGRWLAVEVEDLLKGRESSLEVDAVDLKLCSRSQRSKGSSAC